MVGNLVTNHRDKVNLLVCFIIWVCQAYNRLSKKKLSLVKGFSMDIPTMLYVTAGISAFLIIFVLVAAILIIWLLQDIKMELRYLNDHNISHDSEGGP